MSSKIFAEVFKNIELSANVKSVLKNTIVDDIKISNESSSISIFIHHNRIINESCLPDFKADILNSFPSVSNVYINLKYILDDDNDENKVRKYWNNILSEVRKESPVCYTMIKNADWDIINSSIYITIECKGGFLFKLKGLDTKIRKMLSERFDLDLNIIFKEKIKEKKNISSDDVKEIIAKAIAQASSNDSEQNVRQNNSVPERYTATPKRVKRSNIKITEFQKDSIVKIADSVREGEPITVEGEIIGFDKIETKSGKYLFTVDITDFTDSVTFKFFIKPEDYTEEFNSLLKVKNYIIVKGNVQLDPFSKELNIMASELGKGVPPKQKEDNYPEKRVELHLHTNMSMMDAVTPAADYIKRASEWGHKAIAITDHGVVQAFPEAMEASKKYGVKVLYGCEAYIVDDLADVVQKSKNQSLDSDFVVFDLETTGLKIETDKIIEIGAVKVCNGVITDKFSTFINPKIQISEKITELTSITNEMVKDAPSEDEILPEFFTFFEGCTLVAHNAGFDTGFVYKWANDHDINLDNSVLDTVGLARALFPELNKFKLNVIAKHLGVSLENHHRAIDDAAATAEIFVKCIEILKEKEIYNLDAINSFAGSTIDKKKLRAYHAVIFVKNQIGLRNLYELISESHLKYYYRTPRIPKSEYLKNKEGLIIGTACEAGEFYKAVFEKKPEDTIEQLANFYDYFEIQPIKNNEFMIRQGIVESEQELIDINKKIAELGEKYNKPVVATCDAHFLNPEDEFYRRIIQAGKGLNDVDFQPPLFYRNTEEMLKEFQYLGEEKAKEIVITNTNLIADMIEHVKPIPDETFPPKIDGAEEELTNITMTKAKSIYGDPLPKLVSDRLDRELGSIIKNGFAVLYIIAQKLVWDSNDHGYIVGSRGSVGSSFVATMAGITEVNPLPPHYVCSECKYSDFDSEEVIANLGNSGCDLPDKICPECGANLKKEGHDIPFETFLGFDGDKEPDIDLNFSGEYQQQAHQYTEVLFGKGHVFKAGTIGTLAEKTAYGYVRKYAEERNIHMRSAELNRLKAGCVGVKRTTGQHPGGLMVVPSDNSIYEFCPVQRPANDTESNIVTTHFDYHSISGRLLKLDLLGHDVPTILRMFKDITGFDPLDVPMDDKKTMSLFTSPEALGVNADEINCSTGTFGIPEFGTTFTRQMLMDTKPTTFSELVRISGLSHGTDVWLNNAQELVRNNIATLKEVIPTRDDIMVYLMIKGVEKKTAFTIMEKVRKGKGLSEEHEKVMRDADVPDWYIDSCKKIKYMFPKGHAVAYVTNSFRIGYFKIHFPYAFYAASFSVKAEDFDYSMMCLGDSKVRESIRNIEAQGKDISSKDKNTLTTLELVHEMYARGFKFVPMNLYKSDAKKFVVTDDGLLPPLCTIQGLGVNAAESIVQEREQGRFETIEEFRIRTKVSKTVIELLKESGILNGIPETNQITLFDSI